jgi:hypothetical protein
MLFLLGDKVGRRASRFLRFMGLHLPEEGLEILGRLAQARGLPAIGRRRGRLREQQASPAQ